jgi:hypothetical protein
MPSELAQGNNLANEKVSFPIGGEKTTESLYLAIFLCQLISAYANFGNTKNNQEAFLLQNHHENPITCTA